MQSEENNNDLRKLREDKGLSLESVASQLKLTSEVIKKLETSDFESLGAYTYVRGYLNHYARLLGVDAQPYIDLIPKSKQVVPLINTKSNNSSAIKFKRQSKNFLSYAIGTFVVFAVCFSGYYLLKNYTSPPKNSVEIAQPSDLDILPITQNVDNNKTEADGKENDSFHYSSIIPTDAIKDSSENINSDSAVDQASEQVFDSQNLMPESVVDETILEDVNENPVALYNIVIDATETSWVKVENSDGNKLHNDLLQPGSISLSSDKPVHFRIGNEKKVKVTINGKEINISDYASKDIADFNWPIDV